jgi:hypothetical protein
MDHLVMSTQLTWTSIPKGRVGLAFHHSGLTIHTSHRKLPGDRVLRKQACVPENFEKALE